MEAEGGRQAKEKKEVQSFIIKSPEIHVGTESKRKSG
jgi:hypothetical protein